MNNTLLLNIQSSDTLKEDCQPLEHGYQSATELVHFNIFKSYDDHELKGQVELQAPLNSERIEMIPGSRQLHEPHYNHQEVVIIRDVSALNEESPEFLSNDHQQNSHFKHGEEGENNGNEVPPHLIETYSPRHQVNVLMEGPREGEDGLGTTDS